MDVKEADPYPSLIYSVGITPLQALYPVEVLSFEQRGRSTDEQSFIGRCDGVAEPDNPKHSTLVETCANHSALPVAKGMAFSGFCVQSALLLDSYAWPISIQKITWHTYIIFIVWCAIQTAIFYFFMPETRRRTLEELDEIFEASNPVKESLKPRKVAVDADGTVLASEDA
jgi:hypothetical protein